MTTREYGDKIRHLRLEQGCTLERYARLIGIEPGYLEEVERDEVDPPLSLALKLGTGLGWVIR